MISLADPVSVATASVVFREACGASVMVLSVLMMTIFMNKPEYFDYDDPGDFDSYP